MNPLYKHDCDQCIHLGVDEVNKEDLYYCSASPGGGTLIARRSSDGPEYSSFFVSFFKDKSFLEKINSHRPGLIKAYKLAQKLNLIPAI